MLAFGGTRTYHRMTVAIEDAGFEIRDSLHWVQGAGFPKGHDVSKAIDKAAGAERRVTGERVYADGHVQRSNGTDLGAMNDDGWHGGTGPRTVTAPATPDAERWQGWNTSLKPAHEPIVCARKPFTGTVAANVLTHGTGAINIDATRVAGIVGHRSTGDFNSGGKSTVYGDSAGVRDRVYDKGRWPTNVLLSHSPLLDEHGEPIGDACADGCVPGCPVAEMDRQGGHGTSRRHMQKAAGGVVGNGETHGHMTLTKDNVGGFDDSGGASRFFPVFRYQAKAPAKERPRLPDGTAHPTVKPVALMRWLVRLITPAGGTVLDHFAGSGATLEACAIEGFSCIGIEKDGAHAELCEVRLTAAKAA
jgi:site-specific DNA-methyltransferase (adenine-specific)